MCIDPGLLAAAAARSAPAAADEPSRAHLRTWITNLPTRDRDKILTDLITGSDSHVRSGLLRRYRNEQPTTTPASPATPRTAAELLAAAADIRAERQRRDAEQRE